MVSSLSVVVCTRNRARRLGQALKSIGDMFVPSMLSLEVIVVDNASSDDSREVIQDFARASGLNVRYVFEPHRGLAHARNAALAVAEGQIIAFTDDDCLVDRRWANELVREFEADTDVAMVFGRTKTYSLGQFALSVKDKETREYYTHPAMPWLIGHGNNMAIKRSIADGVGHFDTFMGAGTRIGAGSDTEFIFRVLRSGKRILYSPLPVVHHNHDRTSLSDLRRVHSAYARGRGAFYCKYLLRGDAWSGRTLLSEVVGNTIRLVARPGSRVDALLALQGLLLGSMYRLFHEVRCLAPWRRPQSGVGMTVDDVPGISAAHQQRER